MKAFKFFIIIFIISFSNIFADNWIDISNIHEYDGLIYLRNSSIPFTGKIKDEKDRLYYKDGKPNGKWITFFPNGNIKSIENWQNGKLNGKYIIYQENGKKVMQTRYLNGKDNGEYFLFHENGMPQVKGSFKNGKPSGIWKYYNSSGKLKGKADYTN